MKRLVGLLVLTLSFSYIYACKYGMPTRTFGRNLMTGFSGDAVGLNSEIRFFNFMAGKKGTNSVPLIVRFNRNYKIDPETGCWNWIRSKDEKGYGSFTFNGKHSRAHRFAYMYFIGELIDGMNICHKCDNTSCCNPFHLFQGTSSENTLDSIAKGRRPGAQHGTLTMYGNGCRCEPCVKAGYEYFSKRSKSDEQKALRKEKYQEYKIANNIPDKTPSHGTSSTYRRHGCRCELCTVAYKKSRDRDRETRKIRDQQRKNLAT